MGVVVLSILFILVLLSYFIFYTPFWISNLLYINKFRDINLEYFTKSNNITYNTKFHFDHLKNDGKLVYYKIKNNKVHIKFKQTDKKYDKIYNDYQIVYSNKVPKQYSSFTYATANIIRECLMRNNKQIKIAILISLRDNQKNIYTEGNFIKFAFYTIKPGTSYDNILKTHNEAVSLIKKGNNNVDYVNLYDVIRLFNCDFIINSWRDLSNINMNMKTTILTRYEENKLSKKSIEDIYSIKTKGNVIYLDYYNNNWVISKCINIF